MTVNINSERIVSISEANKNFSRIAKMAESGAVYIFKNNKPKYRLVDIEKEQQAIEDRLIEEAALEIFRKHRKAFEELAK